MRFDNLHINEHTSETCERVTTHQIEELKAALYGGSDKYELTDICKYLEVTPNTWFGEWTKCQMQEYISILVNSLNSMNLLLKTLSNRKQYALTATS